MNSYQLRSVGKIGSPLTKARLINFAVKSRSEYCKNLL